MPFQPAVSKARFLRLLISGISKTGKTYTALRIAQALFPGDHRVAVIDSEFGASKYSGMVDFKFDVNELVDYSPANYVEAMLECQAIRVDGKPKYDVVILDSITHEWAGRGGALEKLEQFKKINPNKNEWSAWGEITPQHNNFLGQINAIRMHLIATGRMKDDYVMQPKKRPDGTEVMTPTKVGLGLIQRTGVEYEFDVQALMDLEHTLAIEGSRIPELDGAVFHRPQGPELAVPIKDWLAGKAIRVDRRVLARLEAVKAEFDRRDIVLVAKTSDPKDTMVRTGTKWKERFFEIIRPYEIDSFEMLKDKQTAIKLYDELVVELQKEQA